MLLWGGWLVVTGLAISLGQGIIHPYYTVALAPPIAAVVGIGATMLWQRRQLPVARMVLGAAMAVTAWWSYRLLERTPNWHPGLRAFVLVAGLAVAVLIVALPHLTGVTARAVAAVALVAGLAGPFAYTLATVTTPHSGAIPSSGPAGAATLGFGPGGGRGGPGGGAGPGGGFGPPAGAVQGGFTGNVGGGFAGGFGGGAAGARGAGGGGRGGVGGILNSSTPSTALVSALKQNASAYRWVAATVSSNQAAGYQLATGDAVMPIGGFNGTDPSPTLAQFQQWVAAGKIHYFIAGGGGGFGGPGGGAGGGSTASSITSWVESTFRSTTVGGVTLYDLTATSAQS
jgi:4-amino-4-deoxy-L-arabinose transferase-like glycosyltransferase